jgi:hypothetical protein
MNKEEFTRLYTCWLKTNEAKDFIKKEKDFKTHELKIFLATFSKENILSIGLDDYVVGKNNNNSFCHFVDYQSKYCYGKIGGQRTNASQKFVIYWDDDKKRYSLGVASKKDPSNKKNNKRTLKYDVTKRDGFGNSTQEIFTAIKVCLYEIIDATLNSDSNEIIKNKLSPQFKNKISFLFSNNTQVPIYSSDDLDLILSWFGIFADHNMDVFCKRTLLYEVFIKKYSKYNPSPAVFARFIYHHDTTRGLLRNKKESKILVLKGREISKVLTSDDILMTHKPGLHSYENDKKKKQIGDTAENIVMQYLKDSGLDSIDNCCKYDDSKGYDFSYVDENGERNYIEVKGTNGGSTKSISFEISANEFNTMNDNIKHYFIYYVINVSKAPTIIIFKAEDINKEEFYTPSHYHAQFINAKK